MTDFVEYATRTADACRQVCTKLETDTVRGTVLLEFKGHGNPAKIFMQGEEATEFMRQVNRVYTKGGGKVCIETARLVVAYSYVQG